MTSNLSGITNMSLVSQNWFLKLFHAVYRVLLLLCFFLKTFELRQLVSVLVFVTHSEENMVAEVTLKITAKTNNTAQSLKSSIVRAPLRGCPRSGALRALESWAVILEINLQVFRYILCQMGYLNELDFHTVRSVPWIVFCLNISSFSCLWHLWQQWKDRLLRSRGVHQYHLEPKTNFYF